MGSSKCRVSRTQLPLTGAYAETDYKAQGHTYARGIIDLADAKAGASPYVMLSRFRSLDSLLLLRPFDAALQWVFATLAGLEMPSPPTRD